MNERLAASRRPYLIGVRHHSPACAVRMAEWLEAFQPQRIFLELPPEFAEWLPWLAHPELQAPVALAGADDKDRLFFYPFADFSPELAAVRWARQHSVEVTAFDLSAGQDAEGPRVALEDGRLDVLRDWQTALGADDFETLWDRRVEAVAPGATAEALRQSALFVGWVHRLQEAAEGLRPRDLTRETAMREALQAAPEERVAAVVGAFHAAALLDPPVLWEARRPTGKARPIRTSLVSYSFDLLDSRSGYPAGIRDPVWQQEVFASRLDPPQIEEAVARLAVDLCRGLRQQRHPAGSPDAQETVRMALELARLRGLPAPGRAELLESVQSVMAQGELLGRGRALARALQETLVGTRRGRLAPGTPRSGLVPHVLDLFQRLSFPSVPGGRTEPMRLDPLRSPLDRLRHVTLRRLQTCGVPYAEHQESAESLTQVWTLEWRPATEAALELAGLRGVTLAQAARGALHGTLPQRLRMAAECALPEVVDELVLELSGPFLQEAVLSALVEALTTVDQVRTGQVPGLPPEDSGEIRGYALPAGFSREAVVAAAVRAVDGLIGSDRIEDARALQELLQFQESGLRLGWALEEMVKRGSPLMQGAAVMARMALGEPEGLKSAGQFLSSWLQGPPGRELAQRLQGALTVGGALLESRPELAVTLLESVAALDDQAFLERVASLREGFEVLSAASRARFLAALGVVDRPLALSGERLARLALADRAGLQAVEELGLAAECGDGRPALSLEDVDQGEPQPAATIAVRGEIDLADRFRLILGQPGAGHARAARAARSLDELYGHGHGEGSRLPVGPGAGGEEPSFPSAWEWGEELEELFGAPVRQEVLGRAAERGRPNALLALDPNSVVPSVELLQQALSLVGALPEQQLTRLRELVRRVIDALVEELATRLRPALTGLASARPTRRPGGLLDLGRTVRANLHTARRHQDGWRLAPERLLFRSRERRSLDWRVVLVVDVSGSMETSVIYSALMAAILAGLPAVSVHFLAFSTEVIDFSARVSDPLALLMEVRVGGGTHIAPALRYARGLLTVPSRSLVVLVSDFEEGGPVEELLAEVRALAETGARPLGLAALSDTGQPRYCTAVAETLVAAGMPVAALTPLELARWVGDQIRGNA